MKQTLEQIIEIGVNKLEEIANIKWQDKNNSLLTRDKFKEAIRLAVVNDGFFKEFTGYNGKDGTSKAMNIIATNIQNRPGQINWERYILELAQYKKCSTCKEIKLLTEFVYQKSKNGKKYPAMCKTCEADRKSNVGHEVIKKRRKIAYENKKNKDPSYFKRKNALARRRLKQRTPKWLSEDEKIVIQDFYANCPEGYHVDHIIPLNGIEVNGLHVLANLQYLLPSENSAKKNRFDIIKFNNL